MKDQLSALIDGELDLENSEHLFTAVKSNTELTREWSNYHLIGDVMRGNQAMRPEISNRIMLAIEKEPTVFAPHLSNKNTPANHENVVVLQHITPNKPGFRMPSVWSVAASFAAVMFVGWMVMQQYSGNSELAPVEIAQSMPVEYLQAHQASVPSNAALFIQPANFAETSR